MGNISTVCTRAQPGGVVVLFYKVPRYRIVFLCNGIIRRQGKKLVIMLYTIFAKCTVR